MKNKSKFKCMCFIKENNWLKYTKHGWGNGYVAVPEDHPLFEKNYSDKINADPEKISFNDNYIGLLCYGLNNERDGIPIDLVINVHGGITYSEFFNNEFIKNATMLSGKKLQGRFWVFGFDTAHHKDTMKNWPKEKVIEETLKLKNILENWDL